MSTQPQPVTIEIYDGTSIQVFPAPLFKRALALAVDYSIVTGVFYVLFILGAILFGGAAVLFAAIAKATAAPDAGLLGKMLLVAAVAVLVLLSFGIVHGYFIYFESKKGSTPGKALFGLQVISTQGGRLTTRQCVMRELFRSFLDVTLVLPGLISILLTQNRQRIGDLVAGTVVVHSSRKEASLESTFVPQEYYGQLLHLLQPRALPEAAAREYLRFCNARFLSVDPGAAAAPGELERWEKVARGQVSAEAAAIDAQSLVLFYAEFLYRTLNNQ